MARTHAPRVNPAALALVSGGSRGPAHTTVTVEIPYRVVSVQNSPRAWRSQQARARLERAMGDRATERAIAWLDANEGRPHWALIFDFVRVSFLRIAPGSLDDDNLRPGFKNIRDGVADALGRRAWVRQRRQCFGPVVKGKARPTRLVGDDSDERASWHYAQQKAGKGKYLAVVELRFSLQKSEDR